MRRGPQGKLVRRTTAVFFAAALLFLGSTTGRADYAPLRLMGGSASPMSSGPHPSIRLDAEDVAIRLHKDSYTVDAVFHFFNTAETDRLSVGFPKRGHGDMSTFRGAEDFLMFETWVDDQRVPWTVEPDSSFIGGFGMNLRELIEHIKANRTEGLSADDSEWIVKKVLFPGHATTKTRVRYEAPYSSSSAGREAYYLYGTGSYWKDSIGVANFTIDGSEIGWIPDTTFSDEPARPIPPETSVSGNVIIYTIRSLNPRPDGKLSILVDLQAPNGKQGLPGRDGTSGEQHKVTGEVVAVSPKSLSIRATPDCEGCSSELMTFQMRVEKTALIPFRRPAVFEKVEVEYSDENGSKLARKVRVMYP